MAGEEVHHLDENPLNNHPDNLLVFKTKADHRRHHMLPDGGRLAELADKSWICYPSSKECCVCKRVFPYTRHNKLYCSQGCSALARRKVNYPSKDVLAKLVWEMPATHIAQQYGVSSKSVEKWCKGYVLEKPPRGYWAKEKRSHL